MENEIRAEQVTEAIARLEYLQSQGLEPSPVREFKTDGTLYYSERTRMGSIVAGILYWVSNEERFEKAIRDFEAEHNAVVFHATHEYTEFGELLDLYFVSSEKDEWEMEFEDLKSGYPFSYVVNLDDPCSCEFGAIAAECAYGGLIRTM